MGLWRSLENEGRRFLPTSLQTFQVFTWSSPRRGEKPEMNGVTCQRFEENVYLPRDNAWLQPGTSPPRGFTVPGLSRGGAGCEEKSIHEEESRAGLHLAWGALPWTLLRPTLLTWLVRLLSQP